jgi:microcystin-dependent protein
MKKSFVLFAFLLLLISIVKAQVGVGTTSPASTAMLDVTSTNKGFLPPRMTTTQRDGIATPVATGLIIYNTDEKVIQIYNGTTWYTASAATTMGAIAASSTANGGTITSGVLSLAPADATNGGIVTTGIQTFAGIKTFNDKVGIGTATPPSKLSVLAGASEPSTPGTNSTGNFRIGVSPIEGIDFGKSGTAPYSGWIQNGYNATDNDPLSLNPLGGNVGIGTMSPLAKLDVTGNIKITDGTQGAGKVLTSDANGLASWQTAGTATNVSGIVAVANGGTGAATLAANNLLVGNGTSAVSTISPATSGNILYANGTNWLSKTLGVGLSGNGASFSNMQPYQTTNYCIATQGIFPSRAGYDAYMGEINIFAFDFVPRGYNACDGAILSVSSNAALFALLGTTYGGNGSTTFALPDYRGRTLIGQGAGPGLSARVLGQSGGTENTTLISSNMPSHTHAVSYN